MAQRLRRVLGSPHLVPGGIVLVVAYIALHCHFDGVDWGDDYTLYLRQAKALTIGNIGEVIHDTHFAVENSGWHSFSPVAYPWGWPLLMAPFYVLFGNNYAVYKLLEVVAFCLFLFMFFTIVKGRVGELAAVLLTLLIGFSPVYVGSTDSVLSDIPYLGCVGVALWWLDRCRRRGILTVDRWMLVVLGLLLAYAFNIRREGISLIVGLAALHLVVLLRIAIRDGLARFRRETDWRRVGLPYGTFLAAAAAFHLLLPTVLLPSTSGTGLSNIPTRFRYFRDALAEQVGLKDPGAAMSLFHSESWARRAVALLIVLAVFGILMRLLHRLEEDAAFVGYVVAACCIVLVSPHQEPRYIFSITPFLVYFAFQALPTLFAFAGWNKRALAVAAAASMVATAGLVSSNARDVAHSYDYHQHNRHTIHGPKSVDGQQMIAAVKERTRGDDVILFFRARAMMHYTDRLAVQGSDLDLMLKRVDWYVMEKGSDYSQTEINDAQAAARGLAKVWENDKWVLWRVPSVPPAPNA